MAFFVPKSPALICYWDFPIKCDIGKLCITSGAFGCDTSKCNVRICIYLKIHELLILVLSWMEFLDSCCSNNHSLAPNKARLFLHIDKNICNIVSSSSSWKIDRQL